MEYVINTIDGDSCIILMQNKNSKGYLYFKQLDGFRKEVGREAIIKTEKLNEAFVFDSIEKAKNAADKIMICAKNCNPDIEIKIKIVCYNYERAEILEKKLDAILEKTQSVLDTETSENSPKKSISMTNKELSEKLIYWVRKLVESGGRAWTLRVPADENHDPDLIMMEAGRRLASDGADSPTRAKEIKTIKYYVKIKSASNHTIHAQKYVESYQVEDNDFLRVTLTYVQKKGLFFDTHTEAQAVCDNLAKLCGSELDPDYKEHRIKLNTWGGVVLVDTIIFVEKEVTDDRPNGTPIEP